MLVILAVGVMLYAKPDWSGWIWTGALLLLLLDLGSQFGSHWFKPRFDPDTGNVQTMMDPDTGKEFASVSPEECAERQLGYCINEDTGQRLVVFDSAKQDRSTNQNRPSSNTKPAPIVFPSVDADGCTGNYALQVNCKRVTLHETAGSSIDWVVDKSTDTRLRCIQFNPSSRLQTSLLRNEDDNPVGTTLTFTGNGQMTYTIFEVPVGQTGPGGARCGS